MFRSSLRHVRPAATSFSTPVSAPVRRLLSTGPNAPKRTWKGTVLRLATAVGAVYFYNTSPIFQDIPMPQTVPSPKQFDESDQLTIDAVIEARRKQIKEEQAAKAAAKAAEDKKKKAEAAAKVSVPSETTDTTTENENENSPEPGSPAALQAEADQQGAFNPETGEINWDCPCLGGMAHGPCGEEFKAAFSCFVYSEVEPKGMDCIEKFQGMQTCFRAHPDVYGAELDDDEGDAAPGASVQEPTGEVVAAAEPVAVSESAVVKEEPKTEESTPKKTQKVQEKAAKSEEKIVKAEPKTA